MADSSAESKKMIILRSSEGGEFKVEKKVAMMMPMIQHAIEDDSADNPIIPLPNIRSKTLALVLEYCTKHATTEPTKTSTDHKGCDDPVVLPTAASSKMSESDGDDEELKGWDKKFIDHADVDTLYGISNAAYLLSVGGLMDLACTKIADMMRGKNAEQIRRMFNLVNDFTPEEEEQMRRDHPWAFE